MGYSEQKEGGGGVLDIMHGCSRLMIDARIPAVSGWSTSGFHRPGRHCLHQARSTMGCFGESHEGLSCILLGTTFEAGSGALCILSRTYMDDIASNDLIQRPDLFSGVTEVEWSA